MAGWSEFYAKKNLSAQSAKMPGRIQLPLSKQDQLKIARAESRDLTGHGCTRAMQRAFDDFGQVRYSTAETLEQRTRERLRTAVYAHNTSDPCFGCRCNCAKGDECEDKLAYTTNREKREAESYA